MLKYNYDRQTKSKYTENKNNTKAESIIHYKPK